MVLGRNPAEILEAWESLDSEESRASVWDHLQRMVSEAGWAEAQQISARAALEALEAAGINAQDE